MNTFVICEQNFHESVLEPALLMGCWLSEWSHCFSQSCFSPARPPERCWGSRLIYSIAGTSFKECTRITKLAASSRTTAQPPLMTATVARTGTTGTRGTICPTRTSLTTGTHVQQDWQEQQAKEQQLRQQPQQRPQMQQSQQLQLQPQSQPQPKPIKRFCWHHVT